MRRLLRLAAFAIGTVVLTGCATMTAGSHSEHDLLFAPYRTYDWGTPDALPAGDPRLDQNPFFNDHVHGAVDRGLEAKRLVRAASGTPDLLVHYHASITTRIDVNRVDREHGYCYEGDCSVRVFDVEAGTLVLDIVDVQRNRVIWRGWAQHRIGNMLDKPDTMARRVEEAVRLILEQLPEGGGTR
jgi:hypothetical protein